jgi:hypothetical protein
MHESEKPSTATSIAAHALSLLGAIGLAVSSFHFFDTLVFFWPYDRMRLLRLAVILIGSGAAIAFGASFFHDTHWWRDFRGTLPLYVLGMGSVGLLNYVWAVYIHRDPGFVTRYEATWFFIALAGLLAAVILGRLHVKRRRRRGLTN